MSVLTLVADSVAPFADDLVGFEPVGLDLVVESANLAQRVDRKYLVDTQTVRRLLGGLMETHRVLEIDRRRTTTYSTTYFDTPSLTSCRAHVQGRRRRWKVRSRMYVEDNLCRVEVKTRSGRGLTIKDAALSHADRYGTLQAGDLEFVRGVLAPLHPEVDARLLAPRAEITYSRACLVDVVAGTRVTLDGALTSIQREGHAWVDEAYVIVETKGGNVPSAADRLLVGLGAQPRSFSKYAATTSLVHPDIADNDVRDLRGTLLHHRLT